MKKFSNQLYFSAFLFFLSSIGNMIHYFFPDFWSKEYNPLSSGIVSLVVAILITVVAREFKNVTKPHKRNYCK